MGTTELHICPACGAGHVEIKGRVAIGYCRCEQVELACPDCGSVLLRTNSHSPLARVAKNPKPIAA